MNTNTKINAAFGGGMLVGGLIVLMVLWFLVVAGDQAAAATEDPVCNTYAAPARCNTVNPPTPWTPEPQAPRDNCVQPEDLGHCSRLLATTGQDSNLHLVSIGVVAVALGSIISILVIWSRHAADKRGD